MIRDCYVIEANGAGYVVRHWSQTEKTPAGWPEVMAKIDSVPAPTLEAATALLPLERMGRRLDSDEIAHFPRAVSGLYFTTLR